MTPRIRGKFIVGEMTELKLECKSQLDIMDGLLFRQSTIGIVEHVVEGILSLVTDEHRYLTNTLLDEALVLCIDQSCDLL